MAKLLDIIRSLIPGLENLASLSSAPTIGPGWLFGTLATVAISLYGLSIGKTKAIMSLLSIYVAFTFDRLFPYIDDIQKIAGESIESYWIRTGVFAIIYCLVFTVFSFSLIRKRLSSTEFSLFGIVMIGLLQMGFLISIFLSFLPETLAKEWTFSFYDYFGSRHALFLWAIAPLPILLFIKRK